MLTLQQLLDELGLALTAGAANADARVRWVHSTELMDPTPWLTGGELLLTTGLQLEEEKHHRDYINSLVHHGIAGLGFGTGFTHPEVPAALVETASELDFPVFEVPYELPFIAITERAFAHLVNEQYEALRRCMAIQGRMERLVLEERGLDEVLAAAAAAVSGVVGVLDGRGEVLACHADRNGLSDREVDTLRRHVTDAGRQPGGPPAPAEVALAPPWGTALLYPVVAPHQVAAHAWLIATRPDEPFGEPEKLIVRQTVTVVALELMRQRIARDTERRLAGDILAEALTGRLDADELAARLRQFGVGEQTAVLAFALADPVAAEPLLSAALARADVPALIVARGDLLCAVIDAGAQDPLDVARAARRELADSGEVRAAASRPLAAHALRRSFHEARCALEAVRLRNGDAPEVASYRDLGAFHLLLGLQDDEALRSYCASVLDPVEEQDNGYAGELLRSLDVFIEHNGHWERAAAALYCHRHTLRYRIRRVEQLTGRDFSNARDRIEVWLALRGRELVR